MSTVNRLDMKTEQGSKPVTISPIPKTCNLIENIDHSTIISLSVDNNDDEYNNPLDYRRDWSYDLDGAKKGNKEIRPMSTELYTILQKTIATIDPCDEFSDVDNDDVSCDSLSIYTPSDIFNEPLDEDVERQKNKLFNLLDFCC